MDNKRKAVLEILGWSLSKDLARKFFRKVYTYMLYNDTESLLEVLDYRKHIQGKITISEDYHLFRFMLQKMKEKHPSRLISLNPMGNW